MRPQEARTREREEREQEHELGQERISHVVTPAAPPSLTMWALGRGRGHDHDGHTPPLPADRRLNDLGDFEYSLARSAVADHSSCASYFLQSRVRSER